MSHRIFLTVALLAAACDPGPVPVESSPPLAVARRTFALEADPVSVTREALVAGASTDVPVSANAGHRSSFDGGPLRVMSAVTGVAFHVGDRVSSAPGGLSPVPHPRLKKENGVEYWSITGELSGVLTDDFGHHWVVGPIDREGTNHSSESYCTTCPADLELRDLCCPEGVAAAHPRAGLPGAFFSLRIPARGFNGGLVQIEPAGDGGSTYAAAPLVWNPIDPVLLLERGYAVFTLGHGGTVHVDTHDGETVIDTNPESESGIFWRHRPARPWEDNWDGVVMVSRIASVDDTGRETAVPGEYEATFWDPWGEGQWVTLPFGQGFPPLASFHTFPEIISDSAIFAKNLVRALSPSSPVDFTAYVGWSGSSRAALMINSNVRAGLFQVPIAVGPQAGGGAYNVWGQPASGLRYDAFVVYAGVDHDNQGYTDRGFGRSEVHPAFPISAPMVWIVPENDFFSPQAVAYHHANQVHRALAALGRGHEVNHFLRIYSIPGASHIPRDDIFAAFDSGEPDGGLWYEVEDAIPSPAAFNTAGRGLRLAGGAAAELRANGPIGASTAFWVHGSAALPRLSPFWLQTFANLRERARHGTPLPVSRVDADLFDDIDEVSTETRAPSYPIADFSWPESDEAFFAEVHAVSHAIHEDSGIDSYPLPPEDVEVFRTFATENPLARSTRPLVAPDRAAPLGHLLYFYDAAFRAPFTTEELRARYVDHGGYVDAFAAATRALVDERLWEERLGAEHVTQAAQSDVLR
jgi:hypothetical protein